jgi:hypothetical protein
VTGPALDPSSGSSAGPPHRAGAADTLTVTLDGVPTTAPAGRTVAAWLLAHGRTAWRRTARDGRQRGLFCGIGVCFDCLLTVNGVPQVRACQRVLADGDDIRTDPATRDD